MFHAYPVYAFFDHGACSCPEIMSLGDLGAYETYVTKRNHHNISFRERKQWHILFVQNGGVIVTARS